MPPLLLAAALASEPAAMPPLDLGNRLELFVDDALIAELTGGAERRLHHPEPREIALQLDRPWEGSVCAYPTVFVDGETVRLYYRGQPGEAGGEVTCTAESRDGGHTFTRPDLALFEVGGTLDNNVVWRGPGAHNFAPFRDANPAAPPDQRYKALGGAPALAFVSPDGLRWRRLQETPVLTDGAFDSQNLAFWDPLRGCYLAFYRDFRDGVRDIKVATSNDFATWTPGVYLDYGEAPAEHLYTNAVAPYFRAPHLLLGFPKRFLPERQRDPAHPVRGLSDGVLMASRDGRHWQRWQEAFLRPGPDPSNWTERNMIIAPQPVPAGPGELALYWIEHYRHDSIRVRRGVMRVDGFVSLHAGSVPGEVLTRPLVFAGKRLELNFATSAAGWLQVALCDADGRPLPGCGFDQFEPLYGDAVDEPVRWRDVDDLSAFAGRPVRLRFRLADADLYALRFAEG